MTAHYRFPEIQSDAHPTETENIHFYDHLIAGVKHGKNLGELCNPRSIAIDTTTSQIYVAEGDFYPIFASVSKFSDTGEYLKTYLLKHVISLWGIAVHGNNVYLTDDTAYAVFHFRIGDEFRLVDRLGREGSEIGQFDFPRQLSLSNNGDVYVADYHNDRIQILDSSLHPIKAVTHPSMHRPSDVKVTTDEICVLSDKDSPCLHVFSHAGQKIRSLITCGEEMQVSLPYFFSVDSNKGLAISDVETNQIKFFSNEGTLLQTIGGQGNQPGMFDNLKGLAFTSNFKLVAVSWNHNYSLQIFSVL